MLDMWLNSLYNSSAAPSNRRDLQSNEISDLKPGVFAGLNGVVAL